MPRRSSPRSAGLFDTFDLGPITMPNRIVAAPMERNYAHSDGTVSPRTRAHYERIAQGGVGWIDLEATFVEQIGRGSPYQLGLSEDRHIAGMRSLVELAHAGGARIGVELHHAGRNTNAGITGFPPIAASPIPGPASAGVPPQEATPADITRIVHAFGKAAARAEEAGFDAIEIHAAHGYLPLSFLSPLFNRRHDEYGGPLRHRLRFLGEVLSAVRLAVGSRLAVGVRISIDELLPGGLEPPEAGAALALLDDDRIIDFAHLSAGVYETGHGIGPSMDAPHGFLVERATIVRALTSIPLILVNRLSFPAAQTVLSEGIADFAAFGRQFLTDPDFPRKLREGRASEIVHCIGCNQGCIDQRNRNSDSTCIVNPSAGRELEPEFRGTRTAARRRIVVVGGGPAGCETARIAAQRGHEVTLVEQSPQLGGLLRSAARPPSREGWQTFVHDLPGRLARAGVRVLTSTAASADLIRALRPEALVLATGSRFATPSVPGEPGLVRIVDVLDFLAAPAPASHTVIAGQGRVALAVAEHALSGRGRVTIVDPRPDLAPSIVRSSSFEKAALARVLDHPRVTVIDGSELWRIEPNAVLTKDAFSIGGLDVRRVDDVDALVVVTDRVPTSLAWHEPSTDYLSHRIGDQREPGDAARAILEGARLGGVI